VWGGAGCGLEQTFESTASREIYRAGFVAGPAFHLAKAWSAKKIVGLAVELDGAPKRPIIDDVDTLRAVIVRLFECRHILVHELPDAAPYEVGNVDRFIAMTDQLLRATNGYVAWLLHGDYPLPQSDMNAQAGEAAAAADKQLVGLVQRIREETQREDFDKAQAAWEAYRAAEADFRTDWESGGSIRPLLHASAMEDLTRERMRALEAFLAGELDLAGPGA
jgi:uncharacterized protein YecT (DUF1311 family)